MTGGAGYIGLLLADELLRAGREVTVLDVLLHGQGRGSAARARRQGRRGRRPRPGRAGEALEGADAVVHLAAIVGDPACARDPAARAGGQRRRVDGARRRRRGAGVERFVMASTCSNYGRMADPTVPIDETGVLAPVSLYAEQKVEVETAPARARPGAVRRHLPALRDRLRRRRRACASTSRSTSSRATCGPTASSRSSASSSGGRTCTCATPRAGSAPCSRRPRDRSAGQVFNVGDSARTTASSTSSEQIREQTDRGEVSYVQPRRGPARLQGVASTRSAARSATR